MKTPNFFFPKNWIFFFQIFSSHSNIYLLANRSTQQIEANLFSVFVLDVIIKKKNHLGNQQRLKHLGARWNAVLPLLSIELKDNTTRGLPFMQHASKHMNHAAGHRIIVREGYISSTVTRAEVQKFSMKLGTWTLLFAALVDDTSWNFPVLLKAPEALGWDNHGHSALHCQRRGAPQAFPLSKTLRRWGERLTFFCYFLCFAKGFCSLSTFQRLSNSPYAS